MNARRYRLLIDMKGQRVERELVLKTDRPVPYMLDWLEDEYEFRAELKKAYWLRDDGVEEQIY